MSPRPACGRRVRSGRAEQREEVPRFDALLGDGKRLFAEGTVPAGLKVTNSRTPGTGVLLVTYGRAGDVEYGSFALEEPSES